jgi:hypothetical protein
VSYVEVAAGPAHTVARRSDGAVVAWGLNDYGQCNVPAPPAGVSYVEVAAGGWRTVARRSDGACPQAVTYCTAKLNSQGCMPAIGFAGAPSATAGSGFLVSTTNVLDSKSGVYFYGKNGPNNVPFQGGTLCAKAPLVRTGLQSSGGTAPCGGTFQIDFNAHVASGKDPALVAGQEVWIQTWSRDPGFTPPNNTSLSDALNFTICQ